MTNIKISNKKAIELLEKSKYIYLTTQTQIITTEIIYYFTFNLCDYCLSIDFNNNAILLYNEVNKNEAYTLLNKTSKRYYEKINMDYKSSSFKDTQIIDYWYTPKTWQTSYLEPCILRFLNDNQEYLTSEEMIKVKQWIINKMATMPLTIDRLYDYINNLRGDKQIWYKECLTLIDGSTMQLIKWLSPKLEQEEKKN